MKAKPVKHVDGTDILCSPEEATHIWLHFPGCFPYRRLPICLGAKVPNAWLWNGNKEEPTISPSILTKGHKVICHSFVKEGKVQFLNDCTHEFAGKTMGLLDVDI